MQENQLFTVWVGLLIICLYRADDVRVSNARPFAIVVWLLHHFENVPSISNNNRASRKFIVYVIHKSI